MKHVTDLPANAVFYIPHDPEPGVMYRVCKGSGQDTRDGRCPECGVLLDGPQWHAVETIAG